VFNFIKHHVYKYKHKLVRKYAISPKKSQKKQGKRKNFYYFWKKLFWKLYVYS